MSTTTLEVSAGALSDYDDWMKASRHGDLLVYWRGDLQFDRSVEIAESDIARTEERKAINTLNAVADRIRRDAKDGQLTLTQRRLGESNYEYRATRIRIEYISGKLHVRDLVPA